MYGIEGRALMRAGRSRSARIHKGWGSPADRERSRRCLDATHGEFRKDPGVSKAL